MTDDLVRRLDLALSSRYAVERELGQGGMAIVFLARDLRHDRRVALKVLRPELAAVLGGERFLQEIRVTASLQHPHILPLHDSGEADGFLFYVMPFVEGESLRDRLNRERYLPIEDAVRIASEVAHALSYAHSRRVIHRDIKPENILLASGAAVVADFGIARAVTEAGAGRLTETGLSLGTPKYMSPEQAGAEREMDGRSDVYSLGCVLYEMVAGEPPYTGPTAQAVVAKLLTESPRPVNTARPSVPGHVAASIHKAMAKLPADRFRTAAEFADALNGLSGTSPAARTEPQDRSERFGVERRHLLVSGLVLAAAVAIGLAGWLRPVARTPGPLLREKLDLPTTARLVDQVGVGPSIALSPDGSVLVYRGAEQLFVRRFDQLDPVPLPNTQGGSQPFFSPDGRHIGFWANGYLKRVDLAGGPAVTLCPVQELAGGTWGPADIIVFAAVGGLYRVPTAGGVAERLALSDTVTGRVYRWPEFLPDGKRVLVTLAGSTMQDIGVVDLGSGAVTSVGGRGAPRSNPRFVEPHWLLFLGGESTVFAVPFDWRSGRTTGDPIPVLENVRRSLAWGDAKLGLSRDGSAVYLTGSAAPRRLALVDRRGKTSLIPTESRPFSDPRFSPDGRAVTATILAPGQGLAGDIWVLDLRQVSLSRVSFDGLHQFPEWSPDGKQLVVVNRAAGVYRIPSGGGPTDVLLETPNVYEAALTRDGRTLVYRQPGVPGDVHYVRLDSLDRPHPLIASPFDERAIAISPDDRWLAYTSNETGRDEVYVRLFAEGGGRWQVSRNGGSEPRWRRDGQELFYRNADTLFAVRVQTRPEFAVRQRSALFTGSYLTNSRHATYDVHPDGQRFIFIVGDRANDDELILVQNLISVLSPSGASARRR